jgi:hypothetical protein
MMRAGKRTEAMLNRAALHPVQYDELIRVGPDGDGGYVVPGDQLAQCKLLLSLGVNDDWSFDRDFVARVPDLRVVGVDHTVGPDLFRRRLLRSLFKLPGYALILHRRKLRHYRRWLAVSIDYFRFFREPHRHVRKMVAASNGPEQITITQLITDHAGSTAAPDVFLKMDIEGWEYECIGDILRNAERIRCLAAEFHHLDTRTDAFNRAMAALAGKFSLVHIHGNNFTAYDRANDFPSTVEITWVNKSLMPAGARPSTRSYPASGLDFPNDPDAADPALHFG